MLDASETYVTNVSSRVYASQLEFKWVCPGELYNICDN